MRLGPWEIGRFKEALPPRARTEIGKTGVSKWDQQGEYNQAMQGLEAIETYEKMRRSDATCAAILYTIKSPLLGAQWYIEPASDSDMDEKVAQFVDYALLKENPYAERTFLEILGEALNMFDYGHYMFEKVWDYGDYYPPDMMRPRAQKMVFLAEMAARPPRTIQEFYYDTNGRFTGIQQEAMDPDGRFLLVDIPADKMVTFVFREEGGDKRGISVLRQAYKSFYFQDHLYKIDAIQKERHALGIPTFTLPMGFNEEDKAAANEMGRNMRTNEKTHIVLPPDWQFDLKTPDGELIDVLKSIQHHNTAIAKTVLAQFLSMGTEGAGGTRSLGDVTTKLFYRAWQFAGQQVCNIFNKQVIPELVGFNFDVKSMPRLMVRKIGEESDQRVLAMALQALVNAKIIIPDDDLEEWIRGELGAPIKDEESERETEDMPAPPDPNKEAVPPGTREDQGTQDEREDNPAAEGVQGE